jgi:hypothetical protein
LGGCDWQSRRQDEGRPWRKHITTTEAVSSPPGEKGHWSQKNIETPPTPQKNRREPGKKACKSRRREDNHENGKKQFIYAMNIKSNGKSRIESGLCATHQSCGGATCVAAILLIVSGAQAQNLFVSASPGNVYEFTPGGVQSTFATGFNTTTPLAFSSAGDLFGTIDSTTNSIIIKITPDGAKSTFAVSAGVQFTTALAFNNLDDLFVATWSGSIYEYTPGGVQSTFATGLNTPYALAFNSAGNLFVASTTGSIIEITPGGVQTTFVPGVQFSSTYPTALAFDSAGDLFVAENASQSIIEITPGGVQTTFASGLYYPSGLAFNSAGDLFETDYGTGNIYEFTPGGAQSTFATGLPNASGLAFPVSYTITASASPANGGTVSGGGTFAAGSSQTVIAVPYSGFTFANWTENGNIESMSASYSFTLTNNEILVADFTAISSDPFCYTTNADNTLTITCYSGPGGAVIIPTTINGLTVTGIGYEAFENCSSLTSVTIPASIGSIGLSAFYNCSNLGGVYFQGNAPLLELSAGSPLTVFSGDTNATAYYLPGTIGWSFLFGGLPTAQWFLPYPVILTCANASFGVQSNAFGFTVSWATNTPVVVEACSNLADPIWSPITNVTLTNGSFYFSDPQWTNYPARFYGIGFP